MARKTRKTRKKGPLKGSAKAAFNRRHPRYKTGAKKGQFRKKAKNRYTR